MTVPAEHSRHHLLPTSLRAVIIASSFWVLSLSLTVVNGSAGSVIGCLIGCYLIDWYLQQAPLMRIRTSSILTAAFLTFLIGNLLARLFVELELISRLFTPIGAFNISEFTKWFVIGATTTISLRTLALRTSFGAILEIMFVATAFVLTLSAHRNGMIQRPFFIGDFALVRGLDPSTILLAFGCGAVLSLSALLMIENNQKRLPYHFLILGLLCFSLVVYVRLFGLPTPQLTDNLGLTGQEQAGNSAQQRNPFYDGDNNTNDREAPVAVVVFRDDYEPLNGSYYFRESAYSQFNGVMLDFARRDDMDQDLIGRFTNSFAEAQQPPMSEEKQNSVRTTVGMLVPHRSPFGLVSPFAYEHIPNPNNLRFKRTYNSYSLAPEYDFEYLIGRETGREDWSSEVSQEYLKLPDDNRYRDLADNLIANLREEYSDDPFAKAWAIKTYLDENGIYSLKNQHAYEADPAASFLFGDLTGYCMHFAFAATYMYRSLGIPARVGIGYAVPSRNRAGGSSLLIQAVHGHAWPEIYFRDIGWVIVDPAPQQTLVDMATDPQNDLQQLLGDMLRNDASFEDFLESQRSPFIELQTLLTALYSIAALALFTGYFVKFYRLWIPANTGADNQYRVTYRAVLDRLSAIGLHRDYAESREEFAARVSQTAPTLARMTDSHLACALGKGYRKNNDIQQWNTLSASVKKEIQNNTRSWRRLIAFLNPFSWTMTR